MSYIWCIIVIYLIDFGQCTAHYTGNSIIATLEFRVSDDTPRSPPLLNLTANPQEWLKYAYADTHTSKTRWREERAPGHFLVNLPYGGQERVLRSPAGKKGQEEPWYESEAVHGGEGDWITRGLTIPTKEKRAHKASRIQNATHHAGKKKECVCMCARVCVCSLKGCWKRAYGQLPTSAVIEIGRWGQGINYHKRKFPEGAVSFYNSAKDINQSLEGSTYFFSQSIARYGLRLQAPSVSF